MQENDDKDSWTREILRHIPFDLIFTYDNTNDYLKLLLQYRQLMPQALVPIISYQLSISRNINL